MRRLLSILIICAGLTAWSILPTSVIADSLPASLRGSYTSDYSHSSENRAHNVELAAKLLNGAIIPAGDTLSFNLRVGKRTEERGFKLANVITDGKYVKGVGGGVCQAATALYNAWLISGMAVQSYRAHTIPASYAPLSLDATVSEWIDLVLLNDTGGTALITAQAVKGRLTVNVYGETKDYTVVLESELLEEIAPGAEIEFTGEKYENGYIIVDEGRSGFKSVAHITVTDADGNAITRLLRRDCYPSRNVKVLAEEIYNRSY